MQVRLGVRKGCEIHFNAAVLTTERAAKEKRGKNDDEKQIEICAEREKTDMQENNVDERKIKNVGRCKQTVGGAAVDNTEIGGGKRGGVDPTLRTC